MPALEEGNIYIRGTFPVHVSLDEVARQSAHRADAAAQVSRSAGRAVPDGPARRRHRSDRLLQRRVSCRSSTRTSGPRSSSAAAGGRCLGPRARTKNELVDAMQRDLDNADSRRRLELLAADPRQRDGDALGREGRKLGQDLRPRPGRAGADRQAACAAGWRTCRASKASASFRSRGSRTWSSPSIARSARCGTSAWPRCRTPCKRPSAARPSPDGRRRADVRHHDALARSSCARTRTRSSTFRSTCIKNRVIADSDSATGPRRPSWGCAARACRCPA